MSDPSFDELRKARKETNKKVHIIDIINGKAIDYESIFKTEDVALKQIEEDVLRLLGETYDHSPSKLHFDKGMILCVFYHKKRQDIIGTVALNQYSRNEISYIEVGLSLIASKYQKMGFQSVEARRIQAGWSKRQRGHA